MKFFLNIFLHPKTALLGHPVQNNFFLFFALIKNQPKRRKVKISRMECRYQNRVKRVCGVISEGIFGKCSKMKILVLTFLKKVTFLGLFQA